MRHYALAAGLAATFTFTLVAPAGAAETLYPSDLSDRTFNGTTKWFPERKATGPCIAGLTCPSIEASQKPSGGFGGDGDGYIQARYLGLLGVASTAELIWTSPPIRYNGVDGKTPAELSFNHARRQAVDQVLTGGDARYHFTIEIIDDENQKVVDTVIDKFAIDNTPDLGFVAFKNELNPANYTIGKTYRIRLRSSNETSVTVLPAMAVDWDEISLVASTEPTTSAGVSTTTSRKVARATPVRARVSGGRLRLTVKCSARLRSACSVRTTSSVGKRKVARGRATIPSGRSRTFSSKLSPRARLYAKKGARIRVRASATARGARKSTTTRTLKAR